jgi:tetratricopeptide (TPR) repeat protein
MNRKLSLILLPLILAACSRDSASVRETLISFVTYPFSDPDPVPRPERNFYPYFRFDGYSKESEDIEWKVVEMENAYVKIHILPEIGGKVWGAIEKSTGNQFVYYNSVVKFRNIAMRGPWTSGGIELNFGVIGHTPAVSTPVDYVVRENPDGSVSCFVGALDLLTRTWWETEINLQPDKAYFTTTTRWTNSTPILQPYYQWSNAAYHAREDLELIFPGSYRVGHGGEADPWPIDEEGRDLSFYRNNAFGRDKSYHIVGGPHGFYAAYWHDLDFGAGHYSTFGDKIGKKVWLWSQARSGGIWEDLLTDSDGQYVELQSGRLFNQASTGSTRTPFKHFGFSPYSSDSFTEYWYPIMDIGGVKGANYVGALNVKRVGNGQKIRFSPLQPIKDEIKVYFGDELKYSFNINLKPLDVWQEEISLNPSAESLKIVVGELVYSEALFNHASGRPVQSPSSFDWNSVYGLYTDGINWIYQSRFDRAYTSLKACLEMDPLFVPALNKMAELYIRKADYETALVYINRSLSIDTYDPGANFIFGLINRRIGNLYDAQDGFAVASVSTGWRNAANVELSKLFILKHQLHNARVYAEKILHQDADNRDALLLMALISRKDGKNNEAIGYLDRLESVSPLNHFARFERMLLGGGRRTADNFTSMIRNELPHETYLEMALWYDYLGYSDEAIRLLEMSPETALGNLKLSWLYNKRNDLGRSDSYFLRAMDYSPDFVLPFRHEFVPVLKWATEKTGDWKPKYYLGLLHWSIDNKENARGLFAQCGQEPGSFQFYMARQDLFSSDPAYNPEPDMRRAFELGQDQWRAHMAIIDHYLATNNVGRALELSTAARKKFPGNDALQYTYAKCLLADGQYSASLNALENTVILPYEGAGYGRITYRQAAIMESLQHFRENKIEQALVSIEKARLWPENLGVGRPYEVDERVENFLKSKFLHRNNQREEAETLLNDIVVYSQNRPGRNTSTDFLYLVVLKNQGNQREIENFLGRWQQNSPNDPMLRWSRLMLNNNLAAARMIEREISTESGGTPWDPRYSDTGYELIKSIAHSVDLNFR